MPVWLIVLSSMVVVMGSVTWLLPSQRDRQRMLLRQQAMQTGFQVRLINPEELKTRFKLDTEAVGLSYYFQRDHRRSNREPSGTLIAVHNGDCWQNQSDNTATTMSAEWQQALAQIPLLSSMVCLVVGGSEVGVLWREQATADEVEQLLSALADLQGVDAG